MDRVSRPLLALLLGTIVFFALWMIALKPSSSDTGGSGGSGAGLGRYNSAIQAAHNAVATANATSAASAAQGAASSGATPTKPATAAQPAAPASRPAASTDASRAEAAGRRAAAAAAARTAAARTASARRARSGASSLVRATPARREKAVIRALRAHRVVVMLFFNPAGADDRLLRAELSSVPTRHGRVLALAAPLSELSRYPAITQQVAISGSPMLVIVNHHGSAFTLVGFQDRFAIAQWVNVAYHS